MTTAAQTVTRNAPETNSRKTQVTVSRAIHVLSTEDEPRQVVSQRDRTCRNLEILNLLKFSAGPAATRSGLATSVLDRLAAEGPLPVSEQLKTEFNRREQAFFTDPDKGEVWAAVREELFGR